MVEGSSGDGEGMLCSVYKTPAQEDTYVFVDGAALTEGTRSDEALEHLPVELRERFPNPELVTRFNLTPGRHLARADAVTVLQSIRERGYYLQLPPAQDEQMAAMAAKNDKLPR